jgi:thiol:disulfide interchange protein DsbC
MFTRHKLAMLGMLSLLPFSGVVYAQTAPTEAAETAEAVEIVETVAAEVAEVANTETTTTVAIETPAATVFPEVVKEALFRTFQADLTSKAQLSADKVAGFYEVILGSDVFYVSENGHHLFIGEVRDTLTGENLTDNTRNGLRKTAMATAKEADMIVFPSEGEVKHTIDIFTDVDCPYCAKLHEEVPKLNAGGVKVRYLAYPRAGKGSKTYNTMESVWCADDTQQAMTDAKARKPVTEKKCDSPLQAHLTLGQEVGVTGTPAMILESGELVPGYVPAERLLGYLEQKPKADNPEIAQ